MSDLEKAKTPDELKKSLEPDPEIRDLRNKVKNLTAKISEFRSTEGLIQNMTEEIVSHVEVMTPDVVKYDPKVTKKSTPCTAVLHLTDFHYGAHQEKAEIEGFGEFSREICNKRIKKVLLEKFIDWIALHRANYTINDLVIPVTADMISGDIHQELKVTNEVPSPVQTVEVAYLLGELIGSIAPHFQTVRVEFIVADNHSRLTLKPQAKEAGYNSFNYIVGKMLERLLSVHANVKINVYPMAEKVINIAGTNYLLMHGNSIMGWAGIPYYGIERRVGKESTARAMMDTPFRFSQILMGHLHAPLNHFNFLIGGSVSGTDAYDHSQGRFSKPSQTAWINHPSHGEFDWTKFWL